MKVLVTGAGGMVGRVVVEHCKSIGDEVIGVAHDDLDIANREAVEQAIGTTAPGLIINCAAWTDVDGCEGNPERAFAANAVGPENLAQASSAHGARLVTISTDYVFDGEKDGFYTQHDEPNPQSVYAVSKLE
ncbi:MAG TPA: sugar nucleotide-binding protein, partial [Pyrinomonadaceae bacterium]|nr:sugar nucleotide-binding protein [Pyrinomonadaceae bacterium]